MVLIYFHEHKCYFIVTLVWSCPLVVLHLDSVHVQLFRIIDCHVLQDHLELIGNGVIQTLFILIGAPRKTYYALLDGNRT